MRIHQQLSSNSSVEPTLPNTYASYELTTGYLEQNEGKTYNLRLWLDENVTLQDPVVGKSIIAKITVTANYIDHIPTDYEKCVSEYGEDSIQCSIIADANDEESGPCPTVNDDGTVVGVIFADLAGEEESGQWRKSAVMSVGDHTQSHQKQD